MKSRALLVSLLLALTVSFAAQQGDDRASIEGTVLRSGSTDPIVGATVFVSAASNVPLTSTVPVRPLPQSPSAKTDGKGRFTLTNLLPGRYRVFASADGYATGEHEQRAKAAAGIPLDIVAGQALKDVSVALLPLGKISGRITDGRSGRALPNMEVYVTRISYNALGTKGLTQVGLDTTDDRGEYRISEIPPGSYYILAGVYQPFGRPLPQNEESPYALTFYPGGVEITSTSRVEVAAGGELTAMDFALGRRTPRSIRGRVIDTNTDRPPASATILLSTVVPGGRGSGASRSSSEIYNPADGSFEFPNLEPWEYRVEVAPGVVGTAALMAGAVPTAVTMVDLARSDAKDLEFRVPVEYGTLSGVVKTENLAQPNWANAVISLRPVPTGRGGSLRPAPDGVISESSVRAGEYRFGLPLVEGAYLKSAFFNGINILEEPFRLVKGAHGRLEFTLSGASAQLEGIVRDPADRPMPGIYTALVPSEREKRIDLYKSTVTEPDGRFAFRGVAPGTYKVFAWEDAQAFMYFDAELLRRSEGQGVTVSLGERGGATVEVRISRPPR